MRKRLPRDAAWAFRAVCSLSHLFAPLQSALRNILGLDARVETKTLRSSSSLHRTRRYDVVVENGWLRHGCYVSGNALGFGGLVQVYGTPRPRACATDLGEAFGQECRHTLPLGRVAGEEVYDLAGSD
jgi:hypothetical protein